MSLNNLTSRFPLRIAQHRDMVNCLLIAMIPCSIYAPFGLHTTGLYEEWNVFSAVDRPWILVGQLTSAYRPLILLPMFLAALVTPDSFLAYNIFMVIFMIGKAFAAYALLRLLVPETRLIAFITSVLFILYPSDKALFSLRILSLHFTVICYLLSCYFLVRFYKRPSKPYFLAMLLAQFVGLLTYDG